MTKLYKVVNTIVLFAIIAFSLLIIASSLNLFGSRIFVVRSGSMEPAIKTGSIVISRASAEYVVGDAITFIKNGNPNTVTHRITEVKQDASGQTFYTVKGDANDSVDSEMVANNTVIGKVLFSVPLIGYLIAFIKTLPGLIMVIIVPATIIIYHEITNITTEVANIKAAKRKAQQEIEKIEDVVEDVIEDIVHEEQKIARTLRKGPSKKGA